MSRTKVESLIGLVYNCWECWDIVGVIILAAAFFSIREIDIEWEKTWDGIGGLAEGQRLQKIDARFGLFSLIVGFLLQILGALKLATPTWGFWVGIALLATVVISHQAVRRTISKKSKYKAPSNFKSSG